jgi:hypothetical protein
MNFHFLVADFHFLAPDFHFLAPDFHFLAPDFHFLVAEFEILVWGLDIVSDGARGCDSGSVPLGKPLKSFRLSITPKPSSPAQKISPPLQRAGASGRTKGLARFGPARSRWRTAPFRS